MPKPSLFVLGSFVVACSARVGRFPQKGETAAASHFIVEAGGKGFNLALGAQRFGAEVASLFAIGDDVFAQTAEPAFLRAGFAPTLLRRYPGQTGSGIGFIDASGETSLAVYAGANLQLSADDVVAVADAIAGAQVVLAQFEISDAPIRAAFAQARAAGIATILNPSPFRMPSPEILADTSILIVNEVEALALASALGDPAAGGRLEAATVTRLQAMGPETLILTRGPRGAIAYQRGVAPLIQPAFSVTALDSLGAGDAFTAALAVGLASGLPFADSLRRAAASGAFATQHAGVFDALATQAELETFLAERPRRSLFRFRTVPRLAQSFGLFLDFPKSILRVEIADSGRGPSNACVRRSLAMGVEATQHTHAGYALDAIAIGVIVTDREARLVYANAAADRLLRQRSGALHCTAGKVAARRSATQSDLRAIIARTCGASGDLPPGGNYLLAEAHATDEPDLALCVVPMPDEASAGQTNAMVLVRPIERDCNVEIEARRLFGLTRKEAKFASAIASGLSLLEAATSDGVSLATARSHLKSIFRKTGLSRQSQVAALLRGAQLPIVGG